MVVSQRIPCSSLVNSEAQWLSDMAEWYRSRRRSKDDHVMKKEFYNCIISKTIRIR